MPTCMIAIGLTAQIHTHKHAGFVQRSFTACVSACRCVCIWQVALYIQLSVCQSLFAALPTVHLYAFHCLPKFIQEYVETFPHS